MKLQLNHIQHYPIGENGLKFKIPGYSGIWNFSGITTHGNSVYIDGTQKKCDYTKNCEIHEAIIYLRPLSDYKDVNSKAMNELNCDIIDMIRISELANKQIGLSSVQHGVIEIMCDNHIDFNRLIESGLAVDINTL